MAKEAIRIVIAGGGTGGHLFPALSVADELRRRHPRAEIVFAGARRGLERRLVPRAGYALYALPLAGLKGAGAPRKLLAAVAAVWATVRCAAWMLRRRPALVIGVGGYASGPAVLAATILRTRRMILEQNHFPGATNRWLAPRVHAVCVPSETAGGRLRGRIVVTGNPVRRDFFEVRDPAPGPRWSLLVFGGSRGARSINRAVVAALPRLARLDPAPRIVHQTGAADESEVRRGYAGYPEGLWHVAPFFDDMPARFAEANLVIGRAGALTIAELCAAGRPSILVPYPFAADDHQRHNAETLQAADAAVVVLDADLDGSALADRVAGLVAEPGRLRAMGDAARKMALPDAADRIADVADRLIAEATRVS